MFASVNMALPLPTRIVIGMSHFLTSYWWAVGGGLMLAGGCSSGTTRRPTASW